MEMKIRTPSNKSESKTGERVYKIIIVGDSGVGKSQLASRFTNNTFSPESEPTVMMDCTRKNLENSEIAVHIWDLAGRETFQSTTSHYKQAQGALVVYDITKVRSFEHVTEWFERIHQTLGSDCVTMLVGNKLDLRHQRSILNEEGQNLATRFDSLFLETSACDATNVERCFMNLIDKVTEKIELTASQNNVEIEDSPQHESTSLTESKSKSEVRETQPKSSAQDSTDERQEETKKKCRFPCCF